MKRSIVLAGLICVAACYSNGDPIAPRPYLDRNHPVVVRVATGNQPIGMVYDAHIIGDSLIGNAGDSSVVEHRPNSRVAVAVKDIRYITVPSTNPVGSSIILVFMLTGAFFALLSATWN